MSVSQIYRIVALVKAGKDASEQRKNNGQRKVRTEDFIKAVKDYIDLDRRVRIQEIADTFDTSVQNIHSLLHDDLGLVIKSSRWIPKELTDAHKEERIRCAQAFLKLYFNLGERFLGQIVTVDETSVSFFMPKSKRTSMQWLSKGSNPP